MVAFESGDEIVAAGGGVVGIGDAGILVGFVIAVVIVQGHDLIACHDVDDAVGDLQAEWLVKAGCKAFPAEFREIIR